jgi:hypothetical protein
MSEENPPIDISAIINQILPLLTTVLTISLIVSLFKEFKDLF